MTCLSAGQKQLCSLNLLLSDSLHLSQSDGKFAQSSTITGSLPSKVLAHHLIEALVMWLIEIPQSLHHLWVNEGMHPPFGLPQAVRFTAALRLLQAGEAFSFVEVEVLVRDDPLETQEVLDFAQLSGWVGYEPLPVDQMDLSPGEPGQPSL